MSNKCDVNPDCLPVEKLFIPVNNGGIIRHVQALDPHWVEDRQLCIYEHPPTNDAGLGAVDAWRDKMQVYLEDLKWLLALEYHKFWSTVLHHPHCLDCLVSFLQEANPPYLEPYHNTSVQTLYEDIRKLVLVIFSRLITNKESKSQYMSKEYMRDVIYNNFIFTIPILFDICLVYGGDNCHHVSRLLTSVFTLQARYITDLEAAIVFVKEAFKYITLQVNKDYDSLEPPNLPETFKGFSDIPRASLVDRGKLSLTMIRDLIIHLLDTVLTLRIFIEGYPKCVDVMRKRGLVLSLVQLYECAIPHLYDQLEELADQTSATHTTVVGYMDAARSEIIDIYREILAVYKNAIFSEPEEMERHVEEYLAVMLEGLSEKLLIKDYHACYPVHEDIDILKQAHPNIDTLKTDFILQAIYCNLDEPETKKTIKIETETPMSNGHTTTDIETQNIPDNEIPSNIREESLISEVKDILPHLGDGFILKCLQHYGFNSERVINSILEDTLDESLRSIDQSLPIIPEDILDKKFLETGVQRLNIFDGDEFDIMTRDDVDTSKIHVGKKKSKYKNMKEMLNDKSVVKNRPDIYNKYNLVCDEERMYDDEYDDTYDEEADVMTHGDVTGDDLGRPFVTPRALLTPAHRRQESSSEEEEEVAEDVKPESSRSRLDFCVNPEEMRARREASYRAKMNKGVRAPQPRNTDVAGKPKGQGQEKEVLKNRDNKEKHKSSRSNHNRRQGAHWKRTQGMVPS